MSKSTRPSPHNTFSSCARGYIKRVQNTAHTFSLWEPKQSFIVGVSGGADSSCLVDIFFFLAQKYDFTLHLAHVNYRLRGKASEEDEAAVRKMAEHYDVPLTVLRPPKKSFTKNEEAYRDIRYQFFEKLRAEKNYDHIAVAHNEDDQAETILLRLLRGSGLSGLGAMRPKNGYVIRPLIMTSRQDILAYLKERHLSYRKDHSNDDPRYLRNRIRHELLPLLEKNFQPKIKKLLATTTMLLAADYALLDTLIPHLVFDQTETTPTFSRRDTLTHPEPVIRHAFRALLKPYFQGNNPPKGLIDEILKMLKSSKKKNQTVSFHGLKLERKGDTVTLLNFPQ